MAAVHAGDAGKVRRLLSAGVGPNVVDLMQYVTPLAAAVQSHCVEIVRMLLESGADPNLIRDREGTAPLSFAANTGHVEIVGMLLEAGADPSLIPYEPKGSALHEAVGVGRLNILRMMIPHTESIDAGMNAGNNPLAGNDIGLGSALEFAADLPQRERFAAALLDAGATPTITALFRAVRAGSAEPVVLLLDAGAPMSISPDRETRTLLDVARAAGHDEIAKILEERS